MECDLEFRELGNNCNRFIQDLEEQGYLIDFIGGYVLIYGLPYLKRAKRAGVRGLGKSC